MINNKYNWAELPKELLQLIGNRLETRIDVYRFRSICTSWRSVVPLSYNKSSTLSPFLKFPPPVSMTAFLSLVTVCRIENETRTSSCLIKLTESSSGKMKIMNPLYVNNRSNNIHKGSIDVLSLRIVEVCKGYRLKVKQRSPYGFCVKKVVLFGNSGIFVIYDVGKLGFFGFKDGNWLVLGSEGIKYDDIVDKNGQFYVVDSLGTVYWIDGNSMSLVQYSPPLFGLGQVKNLVVSEGVFFVVDSYVDDDQEIRLSRPVDSFTRVDMRVYRLDEEWGTWVDVKSLGDRVFVLGNEVCFSVSIKDFPGCDRNCIYFIDTKLEDRHWPRRLIGGYKQCFRRVFDIEDRNRMKTVDCSPSHLNLFSLSTVVDPSKVLIDPPEFPNKSSSSDIRR